MVHLINLFKNCGLYTKIKKIDEEKSESIDDNFEKFTNQIIAKITII